MAQVIIIGAGHAGGSAAAFLKQYGFEGQIILAGTETVAPYQRPPLSKAWLKGEADEASLQLRAPDYYARNDIDLRLGVTATAIDRESKTVSFNDGRTEPYDHLIIATGSRARRLPIAGGDDQGLLELRTTQDAERLKARLGSGKRLIVIGGGYVGLEAAASARALGAEAVVIERMDRVLQRVASQPLSDFYTRRHTSEGVEILTGAEVSAVTATSVTLGDGTVLAADGVLVGIGAIANDELAQAIGLDCADGIVVDLEARTSDSAIFAIGDVTRRPLPHYEGQIHRLESVPNALEQAKQAASAITGRPAPLSEVPWFWSDQYDAKLQIAGLPFGADQQMVRGDPESGNFAVFHLKGDQIVCVEAVNMAPSFLFGKQAIGRASRIDIATLIDVNAPIKSAIIEGVTGV
jgi:3-phenylpropionate/trans-cinnamate dioxygenase ferredoxin reductase subunit